MIPASVSAYAKAGFEVMVETGAGQAAGYPDQRYLDSGAKVVADRDALFTADAILHVRVAGRPGALP